MLNEIFQPIMATLEKSLSTKQVFGEPLQIGGVLLVPVMDLTFGFGGGGGEGRNKNSEGGTGGGGSGGARLVPKAIIVIKDGEVSVLPTGKGGAVDKIIEAVPGLIDRLAAKKGAAPSEAPAES